MMSHFGDYLRVVAFPSIFYPFLLLILKLRPKSRVANRNHNFNL